MLLQSRGEDCGLQLRDRGFEFHSRKRYINQASTGRLLGNAN